MEPHEQRRFSLFGTKADGNAFDPSTVDRIRIRFPSVTLYHHALKQIHSTQISVISSHQTSNTSIPITHEGDGLISTIPNALLTIHTADCVPVIYNDPVTNIYGISHQGWRGSMANMAGAMISRFQSLGSSPSDIQVQIGPAISIQAYEVSSEIVTRLNQNYPQWLDTIIKRTDHSWRFDLRELNRLQLLASGVSADSVTVNQDCTYIQHEEYYSYRREQKALSGQMIHAVVQYRHAQV